MQCPQCNSENEQIRKFCNSCGAPLGKICDRCGVVNRHEDNYCGTCGLSLAPAFQRQHVTSVSELPVPSAKHQFTEREIEDLFALRRSLNIDSKTLTTMGQHEIDTLFGS